MNSSSRILLAVAFAAHLTYADNSHAEDYDMDCAVILCLAGGFPMGCGPAYSYMIKRITSFPPKPPFGFCAMGSMADVEPHLETDDKAAVEASLSQIEDPGVLASLKSIRVEVSRGNSYCSQRDDSYECTHMIYMNGDGSNFSQRTTPGWTRGTRVIYTDFEGVLRNIGNTERHSVISSRCRPHHEDGERCTYEYGWVPIATPITE